MANEIIDGQLKEFAKKTQDDVWQDNHDLFVNSPKTMFPASSRRGNRGLLRIRIYTTHEKEDDGEGSTSPHQTPQFPLPDGFPAMRR